MSRPFEDLLAEKTGDTLTTDPQTRVRVELPASAAAELMRKYREDPEGTKAFFASHGFDIVDLKPVVIDESIRAISCGCCTNGCVCHNHMDIPRGTRPQKCAVHSGTGETVYLPA